MVLVIIFEQIFLFEAGITLAGIFRQVHSEPNFTHQPVILTHEFETQISDLENAYSQMMHSHHYIKELVNSK